MDEMESSSEIKETILCCDCGIAMTPNALNTCINCLSVREGVGPDVQKQYSLLFCRNCERFLKPPNTYVKAALESRALMSICLKKIKGIDKSVKLVDARFIWTEPHSKRIKLKVILQKEIMEGQVLQAETDIEFVVVNQMCDDCHRVEAKDFWKACVQVRQKSTHKKTLYYLEQLILKHKAHLSCSNVTKVHEGMDFFYQHHNEARKMVEFLLAVIPSRTNTAQELISHDIRNNTHNYKTTHILEVVPLCRDDIVCLPTSLANQLGSIAQLCVVMRVTSAVYLIDPCTCKVSIVRGEVYWRNPVRSIVTPKQLVDYTVMEVEVVGGRGGGGKRQGAESSKHMLAEAWVVRTKDLGRDNNLIHCRTHLGHLLKPGDTVLGFDMKNLNPNDDNYDKLNPDYIPDVILIRKVRGVEGVVKKRKWKLKTLNDATQETDSTAHRDYNDFLEDLELEDTTYRQHINIYRDATVATDDESEAEGGGISLAEMLDDLVIGDAVTGEEGSAMME